MECDDYSCISAYVKLFHINVIITRITSGVHLPIRRNAWRNGLTASKGPDHIVLETPSL